MVHIKWLQLQENEFALRRLAREIHLPNGRYAISAASICRQLASLQGQHSSIKDLANLVFCWFNQWKCTVSNAIYTGVLNYNTGEIDETVKDWDFLPNVKDPIMQRLGLVTRKTKTYVYIYE